jgi:hypothetical protein
MSQHCLSQGNLASGPRRLADGTSLAALNPAAPSVGSAGACSRLPRDLLGDHMIALRAAIRVHFRPVSYFWQLADKSHAAPAFLAFGGTHVQRPRPSGAGIFGDRRSKRDRRSMPDRRSPCVSFSASDRVSIPLRRSSLERLSSPCRRSPSPIAAPPLVQL